MKVCVWILAFYLFLPLIPEGNANATDTSAIIEAARERARKVEEVKSALNDPDATVRLAVLEGMLMSDDALLRDTAVEIGLASPEISLRALAFRHAILRRDMVDFEVSVPSGASAEQKKRAQEEIDRGLTNYRLAINRNKVDFSDGTFDAARGVMGGRGKVSGLLITFEWSDWSGEVSLQEDNTLAGTLRQSNRAYAIKGKLF